MYVKRIEICSVILRVTYYYLNKNTKKWVALEKYSFHILDCLCSCRRIVCWARSYFNVLKVSVAFVFEAFTSE
jgi:hypothetical protein